MFDSRLKKSGRRPRSRWLSRFSAAAIAAVVCTVLGAMALAYQSPAPVVFPDSCQFDPDTATLVVAGANFQSGAGISLAGSGSAVGYNRARIKSPKKILVSGLGPFNNAGGLDITITNPDGGTSGSVHLDVQAIDPSALSATDVNLIISQALGGALSVGLKATIAVVDKEGNALGVFAMAGAPDKAVVGTGKTCPAPEDCGLEGIKVPSEFAAISKAGTGAFLSSQGEALSTRTASFIVQEHFPPGVAFISGGPLFGVQFSQLPCSDINPALPLGLSADPGGIPLYKNGHLAGGIGVEGDGLYGLAALPNSGDQPPEELAAVAGSRGFEAPAEITADQIVVNGIRFPYVNTPMPPAPGTQPGIVGGQFLVPVTAAPPSKFATGTIGGITGRVMSNFFPFKGGSVLTQQDVERIILQAAQQCIITRSAIRRPLNSPAQVNIAVADVDGTILGQFSLPDAPLFGFDVCAQKARTAAFYSSAGAGAELSAAEHGRFGEFVAAAAADGLKLDGSVAFTDRAGGFLSRPFFPDGIDGTEHGPFSRPIDEFSPFNDGLQVELVRTALLDILSGKTVSSCTGIAELPNGLQIFPGSAPLYKNGKLAGAIGISGDGVDQDDLIAGMGMAGFEAPAQMRSDRVFVRGVRLPYLKYPRHPDL